MTDAYRAALDRRLPAMRAVDVVLAVLQAAFSADDLLDGGNPWRFRREDPARSSVWVCDPDATVEFTEGSRRSLIIVQRGDYVPSDLHLNNRGDGDWQGRQPYFDHATTMILVQAVSGSKTASEVLASICYGVLKLFREPIMRDFDIHSIKFLGVSPAVVSPDSPGRPWITTVSLRVETQERATMFELTNKLNHLTIQRVLSDLTREQVVSLDASGT